MFFIWIKQTSSLFPVFILQPPAIISNIYNTVMRVVSIFLSSFGQKKQISPICQTIIYDYSLMKYATALKDELQSSSL